MALTPGSWMLGTVLVFLLGSNIKAIEIPKEYKMHNLMKPPIIIEQSPEKYVMFPNDDIVLKCEANGNPKVAFRWTKDGVMFEPDDDLGVSRKKDSGRLVILNSNGNMMKNFQGKYRCYASNELGTAISHEINVITESTPKWQKEVILPIEVEEGQSVVLPCNPPKSAVPPRVIWMNSTLLHITQDERVSMGMNGNLYFSNVLGKDEHPDYICHAQFVGARTIMQKEPIVLKVKPTNSVKFREPRMMVPPDLTSSYLALRGNPLQLECIAEGFPTPDIEWVRLNGLMPRDRLHIDDFKKAMRIDSVLEDDDGEYQCIAKNTQGSVKHVYTVNVESAPYWIQKPESGVYGPGENALLSCEVYGKPKPKVTWMINGVLVRDLQPDPRRKLKDGALILLNMQPNDTVVAQCEASNKHGYILANAYIYVVLLPPQIMTPDNTLYSVVEKTSIFMDCNAFGAPFPTIHWENDLLTSVLGDDRFFLHSNGTLSILEVQREDTGLYRCTAFNNQDNVTISAILDVKNATQIIDAPLDLRVRRGGKATFQCIAVFDPSMDSKRVEWNKDGVEVKEDDDDDKYFIGDYTLSISNVEEDDQGTYTCIARTELDAVERMAELVVIDLPEPPYDLELSDQQDTSIKLTWTPGYENNSPIKEFIIEFEEDSFEPGTWQELTRVDGEHASAKLELSPYVNYQFRVIARNEIGQSNGSKPSDRFKTAKAAPKRNPSEVKGEGTDPGNMYISWKPLRGIDWNGPGFRYIVKWRRQGLGDKWQTEEVSSPPVLVEETETFVPYEIKVQSANDLGEAPEPKSVTGYSGEDVPTVYPENVGVEFLNRNTIKVVWSPVQKKGVRGHVRGYNVYYYMPHGSPGHHPPNKHTVHGDGSHAVITGLAPYSNYSLSARVFNGKGDGPDSAPIVFRTPEGVPSSPAFLRLERQSDTSLTLLWGAPESPNGILTGYIIQYQLVNKTHTSMVTVIEPINDPVQQNWTLRNISSKDTYRFHVRAQTSAGQGSPAIVEGSTLEESEFPPVLNITVHTGHNFVLLNWVQLEGQRNVELKVQIKNKSSEDSWQVYGLVNSTDSQYYVGTLAPGTPYFIRLMALNHSQDVDIWNKMVLTSGIALPSNQRSFATEGWFIGLISAIVLLLLILLILCFIKRSKGGKYSVKDKEDTQVDSEARPMKDETFGEYRSLESDNDEKPFTSSQPSLNGDIKPLGSDDSLADYGGSVDVQFNEDGSFIGQYSGKKEKEAVAGNESSGATSPVIPNVALE